MLNKLLLTMLEMPHVRLAVIERYATENATHLGPVYRVIHNQLNGSVGMSEVVEAVNSAMSLGINLSQYATGIMESRKLPYCNK